jgi:hypothetical protein
MRTILIVIAALLIAHAMLALRPIVLRAFLAWLRRR